MRTVARLTGLVGNKPDWLNGHFVLKQQSSAQRLQETVRDCKLVSS